MEILRFLLSTIAVSCLILAVNATFKLQAARQLTNGLRSRNFPIASYNRLFGSLIGIRRILSNVPVDASSQYLAYLLKRADSKLKSTFYYDYWPYDGPVLVVSSIQGVEKVLRNTELPLCSASQQSGMPISNNPSLTQSPEWHSYKPMLISALSSSSLALQHSQMVEEVSIFSGVLGEKAENGEIVRLKRLTDNFVADLMGVVVFGKSFDVQDEAHSVVTALRRTIEWILTGGTSSVWRRWQPGPRLVQELNSRSLDNYVETELDSIWQAASNKDLPGNKSVASLMIQKLIQTKSTAGGSNTPLDPETKSALAAHLKMLLLTSQHPMSTTICYALYLLGKRPSIGQKLREEHDCVLSPDLSNAKARISKNYQILDDLPWTTAVIKETMRLFPIASPVRSGKAGTSIPSERGASLPSDGCTVSVSNFLLHRDPELWPSPDKFIPERWLATENDKLRPKDGAFRPFGAGTHVCIAEDLVLTTTKLVLLVMVRKFEIRSAYDEWAKIYKVPDVTTVEGERAYLTKEGAPSEGLPCRIHFLNSGLWPDLSRANRQ